MTITFSDLGLPAALTDELARQGIDEPFPIQEATIRDALAGQDVAGRAPTGSGKTLAFGLPILANVGSARPNHPTALILAPTRELAAQIRLDLAPYGKATHRQVFAIFGGVRYPAQKDRLRKGVDVLVATPGRLEDLMEQGSINLSDVTIVAIDEADRMADMGFLPAVRRIVGRTAAKRQTLLFSATLDGDVAVLIRDYQHNPVRHEAGTIESETTDAQHHFWLVQHEDKVQHTADVVEIADRSIVFTRTRHGADRLAKQLTRLGVGAVAMHGGRSQNQRIRALKAFSAGDAQALIATDVAARGIHIDAVASVIHFDPPADHKDYVHRSGRTARAGASGNVVSLVTGEQRRGVRRMQQKLDLDEPISTPELSALHPDGYRPSKRPKQQHEPVRNEPTTQTRQPEAKKQSDKPVRSQQRKPIPAHDGSQSIHVSNLPWSATDEDIRRLFSRYGKVQDASVAIDRRGRSKGYGLINMANPAAKKAIHALNGSKLGGRSLKIKFSEPQRARR